MTAIEGFEILTGTYLGQDWDLFGSTIDQAIANFAHGYSSETVTASIVGFEELLASSMTDDELDHRWIMELHAGYDPRDDGMTYRDFFAHALEVLRTAASERGA